MIETISKVLGIGSSLSIAIPLGVCFIKCRSLPLEGRLLHYFFIIAAVVEASNLLMVLNSINNHWLVNLFSILEFAFYSILYFLLFKPYKFKYATLFFIFIYLALAILGMSGDARNFDSYNNYLHVGGGIFLILYSLFYFDQYNQGEVAEQKSMFWVNTAIFFYFSLSTLFFIFNQVFQQHIPAGNMLVWIFHSLVNIGFNLLLAYGIWQIRSHKTYSSSL